MPTIHQEAGFNFAIYPDDHEPAHVHVKKAGKEVVINLGDDETGPAVRDVHGMKPKDVRKAVRITEREQDYFLTKWGEING